MRELGPAAGALRSGAGHLPPPFVEPRPERAPRARGGVPDDSVAELVESIGPISVQPMGTPIIHSTKRGLRRWPNPPPTCVVTEYNADGRAVIARTWKVILNDDMVMSFEEI